MALLVEARLTPGMDTLAGRWALLEAGVTIIGPDDDRPRPAVLLFHGCGGIREHMTHYAEAAKAVGWRAFIIDSFGPRGWSRQRALFAVCSGMTFRGDQRAGDVLAALDGVSRRRDVDRSRITLAGWSHGGWGIMEAMSADRRAGSLGLRDPGAASLDGVVGAYLAYPYIGFGAFNRMRPWTHCPKTLAVISRTDHLSTVRNAEQVHDMVRRCGAEVETWIADGSHAFDEPGAAKPMLYDPALADEALRRFAALLEDVAVAPANP